MKPVIFLNKWSNLYHLMLATVSEDGENSRLSLSKKPFWQEFVRIDTSTSWSNGSRAISPFHRIGILVTFGLFLPNTSRSSHAPSKSPCVSSPPTAILMLRPIRGANASFANGPTRHELDLPRRMACPNPAPVSPTTRSGESGPASATGRVDSATQTTTAASPRSALLGYPLAAVLRLAFGACLGSTRYGRALASARIPLVLALEVPDATRGPSHARQGNHRADSSHGPRQSNLGQSTHPGRTAVAGPRRCRSDRGQVPTATSQAAFADLEQRSCTTTSARWRRWIFSSCRPPRFACCTSWSFSATSVAGLCISASRSRPNAAWVSQQLREAFPFDSAPRYLIRDRDSIFGDEVRRCLAGLNVEEVVIAPRSPWQNPFVERLIGTIRRELLNHVIVLGERHLHRLLSSYFAYYHQSRPHRALDQNAPEPRAVEPPERGRIVAEPMVGGLHHRYRRCG